MSTPSPKFATKYKFGTKRKRKTPYNFQKCAAVPPPVPDHAENGVLPESSGADAGVLGLVPQSALDNRRGSSSSFRHDTAMLQPEDLRRIESEAQEKLNVLASTPATARKSDFLDRDDAATQASNDLATSFFIASYDSMNALLASTSCKCTICGGNLTVRKGERDFGLAVKFVAECAICGDNVQGWSSPRVSGKAKLRPFVINILAERAMQSTGNGQTAMNDIFAAMNISERGMHNKTWQGHLKTKLVPAATDGAEKLMGTCAQLVRDLYRDLNINSPDNIAISFDGTWMTRGHSSHIGVGTVIELYTGFVLDYVVLSNFCAGCARAPKEVDPAYQAWKEAHACQKNTDKKAGEMEVEAALILFQRSLQKHKLRYTTLLSDGDSRAYLALQDAKVYGYIPVDKEDCVNHIHKRMGTALRNLVSKQKSSGTESLGGKGKLTGELITKLSSYYGWALKSHKGDVKAMHKAVMATYYHITSNDVTSNHTLCPEGPDSWCRQNAAKAKGEPAPKHRHNLPPTGRPSCSLTGTSRFGAFCDHQICK